MGRRTPPPADPLEQSRFSAEELLGYPSLYTPPPAEPGLVSRMVRLPFRLVALPFRLVGFLVRALVSVLTLPFRLVGRLFCRRSPGEHGSAGDQDGTI